MTTAFANPSPGPGLDPATTSDAAADPVAALAEAAGAWLPLLVPPGFTPPAAALLILAAGTTICLGGGRHLRLLLALAGGALAGLLAAGLVATAAPGANVLLPVAGCTVAGGLVAAAAARLLATAVLALSLGIAAPATVAAWDAMAAPHLEPLPAAAGADTVAAPAPSSLAGTAPARGSRSGAVAGAGADSGPAPIRDPGPVAATAGLRSAMLGLAAPPAHPESADEPRVAIGRAAALAGADRLARLALDVGANDRLAEAVADAGRRLRSLAGRDEPVASPSAMADAPVAPHRAASRGASPPAPPRDPTMLLLAIGGIASGVGLGLTRAELAARAATASVGAILVILGGLHLPEGLVAGGWVGPSRPEPVLVAWIALAILGATLQWRYRPPLADIGR